RHGGGSNARASSASASAPGPARALRLTGRGIRSSRGKGHPRGRAVSAAATDPARHRAGGALTRRHALERPGGGQEYAFARRVERNIEAVLLHERYSRIEDQDRALGRRVVHDDPLEKGIQRPRFADLNERHRLRRAARVAEARRIAVFVKRPVKERHSGIRLRPAPALTVATLAALVLPDACEVKARDAVPGPEGRPSEHGARVGRRQESAPSDLQW